MNIDYAGSVWSNIQRTVTSILNIYEKGEFKGLKEFSPDKNRTKAKGTKNVLFFFDQ